MYNSYFGFREKPFNITPNPHFFYANLNYEEAYANLLYGIRERKGFMSIIGEVGTGKTTILQKLMAELDRTVPFVFFYNTTLPFEDLLTYVCEELGLKVNGQAQLGKIQALNEFLLAQLRQGSTAALLIDEAQNLRQDVFENLRLLSNLETPREKLLQIVLSGQPELEAKLEQPELRQVKQRITLQCRLDGLRENEIGAFINCRLKSVDYSRNDLFTQEAVREVAFHSRGIPRLVNIICDNALLITYADSKKKVSAEVIKEVARDLRLDVASRARDPQKTGVATLLHLPKRDDRRANAIVKDELLYSAEALFPPRERDARSAAYVPKEPAPAQPRADLMPQFLDILTRELTEVMGPMAQLVVRSHLSALGDVLNVLPAAKFEKLVELVSPEILNDVSRMAFRGRMSAVIGALNGNDGKLRQDAR
jgi:general secretion pathway protein A